MAITESSHGLLCQQDGKNIFNVYSWGILINRSPRYWQWVTSGSAAKFHLTSLFPWCLSTPWSSVVHVVCCSGGSSARPAGFPSHRSSSYSEWRQSLGQSWPRGAACFRFRLKFLKVKSCLAFLLTNSAEQLVWTVQSSLCYSMYMLASVPLVSLTLGGWPLKPSSFAFVASGIHGWLLSFMVSPAAEKSSVAIGDSVSSKAKFAIFCSTLIYI